MPTYYSRLNLASAIFPFYTEAAGRTIMVPQMDENWDRFNAASTVQDKGVAQVFYMHNVMPIAGGFQSIGYISELQPVAPSANCDDAFILYKPDGSSYIYIPANGANYVYDAVYGYWVSYPFTNIVIPSPVLVTTAYVQGQSYVFYEGYGCFQYSTSLGFSSISLTGLTIANIIGICAANGYMIAWTATAVSWSSLTQATNFVPNIQTGAGGGAVAAAKGDIQFCLAIGGGFMIYCTNNIVGASYTANTSYPYIIAESTGSGGIDSIYNVAYQSTLPYHVALTTAGIQQVQISSCTPIMPEVSDFLTSQLWEDFNETTLSFTQSYLGSQVAVKFAVVSARFIVISYGQYVDTYTHAIVFDILLNRYGKLKIPHVCAFTYDDPEADTPVTYEDLISTPIGSFGPSITYGSFFSGIPSNPIPKKNFAFISSNGSISLVDFEISEANADGVFIIGKYQMQRSNVFVHQETDVESINPGSTFSFYLLPTFDGKDFAAAVPCTLNANDTLIRTYGKRYTAKNISLLCMGAFNLTSIVMKFTIGGFR